MAGETADTVPYWTIGFDDVGPRVPWSGEAVPILQPLPEPPPGGGQVIHFEFPKVPVEIPLPGLPTDFLGKGVIPTYHDLWNWIDGDAGKSTPDVKSSDDTILDRAVNAAKAIAGSATRALGSLVNDAVDYTQATASTILDDLSYVWSTLQDQIDYLDAAVYTSFAHINHIEQISLPNIEHDVATLGDNTWNLVGHAVQSVEEWATDNIYDPLHENIGQVAAAIPVWSEGAYERAKDYTDQAVDGLGINVLKQLVPLTLAVQALQTESEDCVQPMCEVMGPKTDLGKFLKGLKLATELAALTAVLQMDEGDLANLIHAVTSRMAAILGDVEDFFAPGGETVAGLVAAITADIV